MSHLPRTPKRRVHLALLPALALQLAGCGDDCPPEKLTLSLINTSEQRSAAVIDCGDGICVEADGRVTDDSDGSTLFGEILGAQVVVATSSGPPLRVVCTASGEVWVVGPYDSAQWVQVGSAQTEGFSAGVGVDGAALCFGADGITEVTLANESIHHAWQAGNDIEVLEAVHAPAHNTALLRYADGVIGRLDLASMQVENDDIAPATGARHFYRYAVDGPGAIATDGSVWRWLGDDGWEQVGNADDGQTAYVARTHRAQWRVRNDGCVSAGLSLDAPDFEVCLDIGEIKHLWAITFETDLQDGCGAVGNLHLRDANWNETELFTDWAKCDCERFEG